MAYWTIDFKTKANRHIHIRIGGKSGSTNTALIPSDNPCVIEEEGKENLFVPIKTQSGYIEVITDDMSLLTSIIPTTGGTRTVEIFEKESPTSYDTPLWIGYVQPKLLTFSMWRGKQRLRIPIECKLSAMKYKKISLPTTVFISIRNILYYLLGYFTIAQFQGATTFYYDGSAKGLARAWLWKKVYTSIFEKDSTQYDVLEQICTFFGWTARQHKNNVYLIANRNVDAPNTELKSVLTTSLSSSTVSPVSNSWDEVLLNESMFADISTKVKFAEGWRIVRTTSNLISFDESIIVDFEPISTAIDNGSIHSTYLGESDEWTEYISGDRHDFVRTINRYWDSFGQSTPITIGDFTIKGSNIQPILDKQGSTDVSEWKSKLRVWFTVDYTSDTYWVQGTLESPGHYDTDIQVDNRYYGELVITSVNPITFGSKGTIVVNVKVDPEIGSIDSACFFVKIGSQWYNPSNNAWQGSQPSYYMTQREDNNDGVSIPIPQSMNGTLSLIFIPDKNNISYHQHVDKSYDIISISVEYMAEQSEVYNSQINNVEYSTNNGNGFEKEVSFDSLICTKDALNAKSKNFLLDNDEQICAGLYDTLYDNAESFKPLQRLCDQAAAEMAGIGKMYEITARWRGGLIHDITPITMIYVSPLSEWCYPVSAEYNLRDDIVKLRLVKRIYSEGNQ